MVASNKPPRSIPPADPLAAEIDNLLMAWREHQKARRGVSIVRQVTQRIADAQAHATRVKNPAVY